MKTWYSNDHKTKENNLFVSLVSELSFNFINNSDIQNFLNSLYVLDSVPISGLVADGNMIPEESLSLFYVDPNWIDCLLDGAMSIGRNCSEDFAHDKSIINTIRNHSYLQASFIRRIKHCKAIDNNTTEDIRTGFLLNSKLVKGWPGLEAECYKDNKSLNILKLSIIGDSIMFCIVDGELNKILLTEPSESLYFGFEDDNGKFIKMLVSQKEGEIGQDINTSEQLVFHNEEKKLIDVKKLAENMYNTLDNKGKAGKYFSSLEFAMQMLHERTQCIIEIDNTNYKDDEKSDNIE